MSVDEHEARLEALRALELLGRQHPGPELESAFDRVIAAGVPRWRALVALAQGAMQGRDAARALAVIERGSVFDLERAESVQLRVQALTELARTEEARRVAERHLLAHPDDGVVRRLWSRVRREPRELRASMPLVSVERAMRLTRLGRVEEALQMFRLLAWEHPSERKLRVAIRKLEHKLERARDPEGPAPLQMGEPGVGR